MAHTQDENVSPIEPSNPPRRTTANSTAASSSSGGIAGKIRAATTKLLESSPPAGMWDATGKSLAKAPTPLEIRRGSFSHNGWDGPMQRRHSMTNDDNVLRLSRTNSAQTPGTGKSTASPMDTHKEHEDEPDFANFLGRGRIDDQSFAPRPKATPRFVADPLAIPNDSELEAEFAEDGIEKPVVERPLPKKFRDPSEDVPSSQTQKRSEQSPDQFYDAPSQPHRPRSKFIDPLADSDDPLPEVYGRGEMNDQIHVPRASKILPKKFADPSDTAVPYPKSSTTNKPDLTKQTTVSETARPSSSSSTPTAPKGPDADGVYPNGYQFPPKHTWGESTLIGLKGFWRFFITPFGFLVTLYGLNVVAWGGMLFLLLIGGGSEYMCYPARLHGIKDCSDLYSPRRIWIEIDSQILNALFCVTGFGLIWWRFRDLFYLMQYRIGGNHNALRKLAGINRTWLRLAGSHDLPVPLNLSSTLPTSSSLTAEHNPSLPLPVSKTPDEPLTGIRAPPTKLWRLDFVIWAYVLNTFLQAVLSGFMWGFNRFDRPSWSTGTFVALACIVAGLGGLMAFVETKRVKKVEGIPASEEEALADVEKGVEEKKAIKEGKHHHSMFGHQEKGKKKKAGEEKL